MWFTMKHYKINQEKYFVGVIKKKQFVEQQTEKIIKFNKENVNFIFQAKRPHHYSR